MPHADNFDSLLEKVPFLRSLLDDPAPVVRESLRDTLGVLWADRGARRRLLEQARLTEGELQQISRLGAAYQREWLVRQWPADTLEQGLLLVDRFQSGALRSHVAQCHLDGLAAGFLQWDRDERENSWHAPPLRLTRFFFDHLGYRALASDDCAPRHYHLTSVLRAKEGAGILLGCMIILLGKRLDMPLEACYWPGNFLIRTVIEEETYLIDCHRKGRWVDKISFLRMQGPSRFAAQRVLARKMSPMRLTARVLHGLEEAYQRHCHFENADLMARLQRLLEPHFEAQPYISDRYTRPDEE